MKKQDLKMCVVCLGVIVAGLCYSCVGFSGSSEAKETLLLAETAGPGEISAAGTEFLLTAGASGPASGIPNDPVREEEQTGDSLNVGAGAEETERPAPVCYVHICGEVCQPGVYELTEGSRIFQALELAGGFTEEAAVSYLNLAQEVTDGMKIVVPSESDVKAWEAGSQADFSAGVYDAVLSAAGPGTAAGDVSGGKVNLNTADKAALMALPGIGEAKAEAILRYRQEYGPFERIEDVMQVPGIKEAAFEKMKEDITV